jgi:anti-sigma regulatory factor (Ser/Thr protein kinase)
VFVAVLQDLDNKGLVANGSQYRPPKNELVERYLARMDFERILIDAVEPEPFNRRTEKGFRPCQLFADEAELDGLVASLTGAVREVSQLAGGAHHAISWALDEIARNVVQHARSASPAVGVVQHARSRRQVEVAIVDRGVGVLASLRENPEHQGIVSDLEAIRAALKPGVTGVPKGKGGIGLFLTQILLREGGLLVIRSGSASVESSEEEIGRNGLPNFPGTLVVLRAPTDRPLNLGGVLKLATAIMEGKT